MKILQVHNLYREAGGEDVVARLEAELLSGEHEVDRWLLDNTEELQSLIARVKLLFTTHYSGRTRRKAADRLRSGNYGLMHVHNFFPLFTPSVFDAARELGIPSVLTLHNYRLIHPNGMLFHDGEIDERSVKGSAWSCVRDGVYRDSVFQTAVVAHMIEYHRRRGTWERVPDLFIALSNFAKKKLSEGGIPAERIVVKPNFVKDPGEAYFHENPMSRSNDSPRFLYVGRISSEKGIEDLVDTWMDRDIGYELRIAGVGPEKDRLQKRTSDNNRIQWLGYLKRKEILKEMSAATALIFPSRWYEGYPMTLIEALSTGCPVLTTNIGSQAEIIEHEKTGLHVLPGDPESMTEAVHRLSKQPDFTGHLSANARQAYLDRNTPEANYRQLVEIYQQARSLVKSSSSVVNNREGNRSSAPDTTEVLGIPLFNKSIRLAAEQIIEECSGEKNNHCISATGAHGIVYAFKNPLFKNLLQSFYMNLPDGMPAVWVGRAKGAREMERCYGPDFFARMMSETAGHPLKHFFCGGREGVPEKLKDVCETVFGNRNICGTYSPPFREIGGYDYEEIARQINEAGAHIVWIGISTPKQEQFAARLAEHTDVHFLITVGAAFDFHIGNIRQAPKWMQQSGLEWFFRLCMEPRRLMRRYIEIVPLFIYYALLDLIRFNLKK
ncbi:MAG: WecB/TagA/CpsF family glycosyltransferase [Balneolaceae bacterium]